MNVTSRRILEAALSSAQADLDEKRQNLLNAQKALQAAENDFLASQKYHHDLAETLTPRPI